MPQTDPRILTSLHKESNPIPRLNLSNKTIESSRQGWPVFSKYLYRYSHCEHQESLIVKPSSTPVPYVESVYLGRECFCASLLWIPDLTLLSCLWMVLLLGVKGTLNIAKESSRTAPSSTHQSSPNRGGTFYSLEDKGESFYCFGRALLVRNLLTIQSLI